jgi:predicted RNA-binding Zn-ribbon protein involved in translation (DUF1610 family)
MIFKLLLFLLAGAIINVAVAWGCAYQEHPEATDGYYTNAKWGFIHWVQRGRERRMYARYAFADVAWEERPDLSPSWASTSRELDEPAHERAMWVEDAAGWPLLSVVGRCRLWPQSLFVESTRHAILLEPTMPLSPKMVMFPYRPIFPGLAINTIFYAAIVWALFAVPGAVRRRVRHKRGQCASCGYSLRGRDITSEKCPECGATTIKHKAETQKA